VVTAPRRDRRGAVCLQQQDHGDEIYLTRVKPAFENMNYDSKYEFLRRETLPGKAIWTPDFSNIHRSPRGRTNKGCVTI
jgi:hypothetical protein